MTNQGAAMARLILSGGQKYEPLPMVQQGRCVGYAAIMIDLGGNLYLAATGEHSVHAEAPHYIYPTTEEANSAIAAWQMHAHDAEHAEDAEHAAVSDESQPQLAR